MLNQKVIMHYKSLRKKIYIRYTTELIKKIPDSIKFKIKFKQHLLFFFKKSKNNTQNFLNEMSY